MFTLSVEDDQGRKTELQFAAPGITIGRAKDNQLRLNERNVSRKHARINATNGSVSIEDLDSYNGIRVNGDRISAKTSLYLGDSIQLGDFKLQLSGDTLRPRPEEITQKTTIPKKDEEVTNTEPMVVAPLNTGPQAQMQPPVQQPKQQPAAQQMDRDESTALIRLSDIAPKGAGPAQSISGPHPKLVCIKGPMAGREWPVSKTEVIIGRGQENDVVIDHRSLSRQHAKIVLNGSQYRVVDFNSSNGTLVNGERYAQVDLKRGDIIELGHVKFRLMWPGETAPVIEQARDDAFDESTEVVRPAARSSAGPLTQANQQPVKNNKGLFIAIGVGSLVAVVAIVLVIGLQSESSQAQGVSPKVAAADVPVQHDITTPPTNAVPATPPPTTAPANQDVSVILKRANTEMASEQWDQAIRILETALETQPGQLALKAALERCEKERSAKTALDAGNAGYNRGDYIGAKDSFQQVPESSMYYQRASKRLQDPKIRTAGVVVAKAPKTDKPERTEKPERFVEPKPEPKAVKAPKEDPPPQKDPPVVAQPPPAAAESPRDQAKKLFDQGNKALLQNKNKEAIELYLEATRTDGKYALPHRGLGIAHARAGNGEAAVEHYKIYLKLAPGAADAEQVKKIIHDYESPD